MQRQQQNDQLSKNQVEAVQEILFTSAKNNLPKFISAALEAGANVNSSMDFNLGDISGPMTPLIVAAYHSHIEAMTALLSAGASCTTATKHGATPLMIVAFNGNLSALKLLLLYKGRAFDGRYINTRCSLHGKTALAYAVGKGHLPIVKELLNQLADPLISDNSGLTALHIAAKTGQAEILEELITCLVKRGTKFNLDIPGYENRSPLCEAAILGDFNSVLYLLEAGASVAAKDVTNKTAREWAQANHHIRIVELLKKYEDLQMAKNEALFKAVIDNDSGAITDLLDGGADIDCMIYPRRDISDSRLTPLMMASHLGLSHIVKLLLDRGASSRILTVSKSTALHFASRCTKPEVMHLLISSLGADAKRYIELKDEKGYAAIHYCNEDKHLAPLKELIQAGANLELECQNKDTILNLVARNNQVNCIRLLLDAGANCNHKGHNGNTPRMQAAFHGSLAALMLLMDSDVDYYLQNNNNDTILHLPVFDAHIEVIDYLLTHAHININTPGQQGLTPLALAATIGHVMVVNHLISAGANVDAKDNNGATPLMRAVKENKKDVVQLFLSSTKANIDITNAEGDTALMLAIKRTLYLVTDILEAKPQLDITNKEGFNALHLAILAGNITNIASLIDAGASLTAATTISNQTPLQLAKQNGKTEVIDVLNAFLLSLEESKTIHAMPEPAVKNIEETKTNPALNQVDMDGLNQILAHINKSIEKNPETLKLPSGVGIEDAFLIIYALIKEQHLPELNEYLKYVPSHLFISAAIRLFAYQNDSISVDFIMEYFLTFERPLDAAFGYAWGKHLLQIDDSYGCGIPLYKAEGFAFGYHLEELNDYLALSGDQDSSLCIHACEGLMAGGHLDNFDSTLATLSKITDKALRKQILHEVQNKAFPDIDLLPGAARKIKMLRRVHTISYEYALKIVNDIEHVNETTPIHSVGLFESAANQKLNFCQKKCVTQLKDKGMTLSIMLNWHKNKQSSQDCEFGNSHLVTLAKLLNMNTALNAAGAIREIDALDTNQVDLLDELFVCGLRGNHLREWQNAHPGRHISHREVESMLHHCLNEKANPVEFLSKISGDLPRIKVIKK